MAGQKKRRWLGGYVRVGKNGKETFIIDKWIRREHFHLSTRCNTERAALKQYERFEADPYGFSPLGDDSERLFITDKLVADFAAFMRDVKKNSRPWIKDTLRYLSHWSDDLAGRDLRALNVQRDLLPVLDKRKTSRRHRIEAIKSFCSWLRTVKGLLHAANDATMNLRVPKTTAEKTRRRKVVAEEHIRRVMPLLPDEARDVMVMQLATAFHVAEVRRFAEIGDIVYYAGGPILAAVTVKHKSGELVTQPIVDRDHLAAIERIKARGRIPINWTLAENMKTACNQVRREEELRGVPEDQRMPQWRLGQMRHTVLTMAVMGGATAEQAAAFAHHRSSETTKRFYIDLAVPTLTVPVLRLVQAQKEEKAG